MYSLYNFTINLSQAALPLGKFFSKKLKLFVEGRRQVFDQLKEKVNPQDKFIWFHTASLGEFEQAVPVIEMVREKFPEHKVLVSFFSPSGYENKKEHPLADVITYLPLDTSKNARTFLDILQPELVFFIKYDIWPNFLKELKIRKTRTFLVSGAFRDEQIYFKTYGKWMRQALNTFEHFFVQNQESADLLRSIGFKNTSISGDTRFDRVSRQIEYDNRLDFIEEFVREQPCIVAGSTWPEDENLLVPYINSAPENVKIIIAPHEIESSKMAHLKDRIKQKTILFSEKEGRDLSQYQVLIINTIGLLTKIYSYASIAYVGGAAGKTGLHNILEPATFGTPIVIGHNFSKYPEANRLRELAGLFSVNSREELNDIFEKLLRNEKFRKKTGMIAGHFINNHTGATATLGSYLSNSLPKN